MCNVNIYSSAVCRGFSSVTELWVWFLRLVAQRPHMWVGRGGMSVTCPTHPICPDKLLFWGLRTVINTFSSLFCWSMPLALKVPVWRLCTVCLTTVTYFAMNLGYFFPVRRLNNLVFDSSINAVHVQTVLCCYREQQKLPAEPQLSLHSQLGLSQWAPGFGKEIWNALGLPKGATAPPAQTPIPQQHGHEV